MAKKKLPDFSLRSGELKHYFSAENTQPIAEKSGFPPDYPLVDRLNYAASWLDPQGKENLTRLPEGAEGKAFWEELAKHATNLAEYFDKLGLGIIVLRAHGLDVNVSDYGPNLRRVANAASNAAKNIPNKNPGRKPDIAFYGYIEGLRKIYYEGTGKKDRVTRDPSVVISKESYKGNFFEFVKACLSVVGITKSDPVVAKAIEQTLHFMDKHANLDAPTSQ